MKTLTIDDKDAKKLYPTASTEFKTVLESTFGKDFFSEKITDRVKTFKDACSELGIDPHQVWIDGEDNDEVAYKMLKVIVKALNEGWTPDWNNTNQPKYYPWFELQGGFRLYTACTSATPARSSAPAFASNRANWLLMPESNLKTCTNNFSPYNPRY